jgi:hypothetical protein
MSAFVFLDSLMKTRRRRKDEERLQTSPHGTDAHAF